jgi:hypothetical protein
MRKVVAGGFSLLLVALMGTASAGPKWEYGDDSWMTVGFLGQVHYRYSTDQLPEGDVYLRRARLIMAGQITEGVKAFVETDNDNEGKAGTQNVSMDIQDAFVDLQIMGSDHWVEAGLILLPFSFETKSSAASLLGLDYNLETIKLVNSFVWRDYGLELHGNFGSRAAYRVGVFDGFDSKDNMKNPGAGARLTGHAAFNVLGEVETGWFMTQSRFEGTYLSLGFGADHQDQATLTPVDPEDEALGGVVENNTATVLDFQSGFDIKPTHVTVNGAYYDWDNANFDGATMFLEAGVLYNKFMVTGKYSVQDPKSGTDTADTTVGLHYFAKKNALRGGLEYRFGDSDETVLLGIQFML